MTLISYRHRIAAIAGRERFTLTPEIDQLEDGHPLKRFVCLLVLYAREVQLGKLPDEPARYLPHRGELFARAALIPEREFRARAHRSDQELAEHFRVPVEQIPLRRAEVATGPPPPGRARARRVCAADIRG